MRIARLVVLLFAFALSLTVINSSPAQQTNGVSVAPIPAPIFTVKRVFISNSSAEFAMPTGTPEETYDQFYAYMKSWGRYELVSSPSEADLVFDISFKFSRVPLIRLVIMDPKTHVVLWPIFRQVKTWARPSTARKNFDQAMTALMDDLKKLTNQGPVNGAAAKS